MTNYCAIAAGQLRRDDPTASADAAAVVSATLFCVDNNIKKYAQKKKKKLYSTSPWINVNNIADKTPLYTY